MPRTPKTQRWTDLLAALLRRRFATEFVELAREVPAYSDATQSDDARMRMFERDKDELRAFGVPIESVVMDDGETHGYRLAAADFYLPYLAFATDTGVEKPEKVDKYGYRSIQTLTFEPDELSALADAATRLRTLGDSALAADIDSAVRKLAFDLPLDVGVATDGVAIVKARETVDHEVFEQLGDALLRRKRVKFVYRSMSSDETGGRSVEPYGLYFLDSHWYLAGRDIDREAIRNFRLSRIAGVEVNTAKSQSDDFAVPAEFDLRLHARARHAWELGDDDALPAIVEFTRTSGAAVAAMSLGEPVDGHESQRRFNVRRTDVFCRWVLAFAGDAVIVEPESLELEYRQLVWETRKMYSTSADPSLRSG